MPCLYLKFKKPDKEQLKILFEFRPEDIDNLFYGLFFKIGSFNQVTD